MRKARLQAAFWGRVQEALAAGGGVGGSGTRGGTRCPSSSQGGC